MSAYKKQQQKQKFKYDAFIAYNKAPKHGSDMNSSNIYEGDSKSFRTLLIKSREM